MKLSFWNQFSAGHYVWPSKVSSFRNKIDRITIASEFRKQNSTKTDGISVEGLRYHLLVALIIMHCMRQSKRWRWKKRSVTKNYLKCIPCAYYKSQIAVISIWKNEEEEETQRNKFLFVYSFIMFIVAQTFCLFFSFSVCFCVICFFRRL